MKKIIMFLLIFIMFYQNTYSWLCVTGKNYIIIKYSNLNNELTIKWWGFYDTFLNWPFYETKNITNLWVHYLDNPFCKYKNFENITKLKFKDLKTEDKELLILNILLSFTFILSLLFLLKKLNKIKK